MEDFKSKTSYKYEVSQLKEKDNPFNRLKLFEMDFIGEVEPRDLSDEFGYESDGDSDESDFEDIEIF